MMLKEVFFLILGVVASAAVAVAAQPITLKVEWSYPSRDIAFVGDGVVSLNGDELPPMPKASHVVVSEAEGTTVFSADLVIPDTIPILAVVGGDYRMKVKSIGGATESGWSDVAHLSLKLDAPAGLLFGLKKN